MLYMKTGRSTKCQEHHTHRSRRNLTVLTNITIGDKTDVEDINNLWKDHNGQIQVYLKMFQKVC